MLLATGNGGPLLYGHRGAPQRHPENSMAAFRSALEGGADVLEIDVHMTADGHVVVAHDGDGSRMAGVDREICQTPLSELQTWDIGQGFGGRVGQGEAPVRVPTLEQVLTELPDAALNIDVKQGDPDMVRPLLRLLDRHNASGRVLLTSFEHPTITRIRRAGYTGQTGLSQREAFEALILPLSLRALGGAAGHSSVGSRLQIPPCYAGLDLGSPRLIEHFHRQGLRVDFWVINELEHAQRLLDAGADGIVTDRPHEMAELFASHPRTHAWRQRHARQPG